MLVTPPDIVVGPLTLLPKATVCRTASWVARVAKDDASLVGACPARPDLSLADAPIMARTKLPREVGCDTITNRLECGRYTDGRNMAAYNGQPCVAAVTQFSDGTLCNDAKWVQELDALHAATLQPLADGQLSYRVGQDTVHHQVQLIRLKQVAPRRMVQTVTFHGVDCEPFYPTAHGAPMQTPECMRDLNGDAMGNVYMVHSGRVSPAISLASLVDDSASGPHPQAGQRIEQAFEPLQDLTYSRMTASVISVTRTRLVWRVELATPFASCTNQRSLPLLSFVREAKVNVSVEVSEYATCLDGGAELSFESPAAFGSNADGYLETEALRMEIEKRNSGGDGTSLWME